LRLKTGGFGIDGDQVIEVGGPDKGFSQVKGEIEDRQMGFGKSH